MKSFLHLVVFVFIGIRSPLFAQDFKLQAGKILELPKFSYKGDYSEWRSDSSEFFTCSGFVAMVKEKNDTNYGYHILLEDSIFVRAYLYGKIWVYNKLTGEATVGTFIERNHQLHSNNLAANCLFNFLIYDAYVTNSKNTESSYTNVKSAYYTSQYSGNDKILELKTSSGILPDEYWVIPVNKDISPTKKITVSDKNYNFDIQDLFKAKMPDTSKFKAFKPEKFELEYLDSGFSFSGIKVFDPISNDSFFLTERYKGKYLILDFMFFGCMPCIKSIPDIVKANNNYINQNVRIIALNGNDKPESNKFKEYKKIHQINYPVFSISKDLLVRLKKQLSPTYVLLSPEGYVIADIPLSFSSALSKLDEVLNKKK